MEGRKPTRRRGNFAAPAAKPDNSDEAVLRVMREMISEGKDLTADEAPEAPALSTRLGFQVGSKRRDLLMKKL